jgi:hypothetical protein
MNVLQRNPQVERDEQVMHDAARIFMNILIAQGVVTNTSVFKILEEEADKQGFYLRSEFFLEGKIQFFSKKPK